MKKSLVLLGLVTTVLFTSFAYAQESFPETEYMTFSIGKNTEHTVSLYVDKTYPVPKRYNLKKIYHYAKHAHEQNTEYSYKIIQAQKHKNDIIVVTDINDGSVYHVSRHGVYPVHIPDDNIMLYMNKAHIVYKVLLNKAA